MRVLFARTLPLTWSSIECIFILLAANRMSWPALGDSKFASDIWPVLYVLFLKLVANCSCLDLNISVSSDIFTDCSSDVSCARLCEWSKVGSG